KRNPHPLSLRQNRMETSYQSALVENGLSHTNPYLYSFHESSSCSEERFHVLTWKNSCQVIVISFFRKIKSKNNTDYNIKKMCNTDKLDSCWTIEVYTIAKGMYEIKDDFI